MGLILTGHLCAISVPASASVVYVNANQTNNVADGASWATAFPKVQQGVDAAGSGDAVWVASAIYFENITLKSGVAMYGGFTGTELNLEQRSWTSNQTILDGRGSNSVVRITAGTNMTRLDGFVLRNGNANRGGGIYCANAVPEIVNNVILQNRATNNGGGIYCSLSSPLIASNLIQGNIISSAGFGGAGIGCEDSTPRIQHNRIIANSHIETSQFGAVYTAGGIICAFGPSAEIANNFLLANTVTGFAQDNAGGILIFNVGTSHIVNNTIAWCQTQSPLPAGGIYCRGAPATIVNNIVAFCSGGIAAAASGLFLGNNCVFGNGQNFTGLTDPTGSNGNISVDPQFATNAFYPDVHLLASSPCRDTGDSTSVPSGSLDMDGDARIIGVAVDIGADEFNEAPPIYTPTIVRVSTSGDDAKDGSTWTNAKRTVQAAMGATTLKGGQVWVQAGTYHENLTLRHFVHLYGGFTGTETNATQRDWTSNATILDGNFSGQVITARELQGWNVIDGFVIRNGHAREGAGIYCNGSAPIISHNLITNNIATPTNSIPNGVGGGIYCFAPSTYPWTPIIISNIFHSNRAVVGGGIACAGSGPILIANNRFEANVAQVVDPRPGFAANGGGGIFLYRVARPIIQGNYFLKNIATNTSFALGEGGAICVDNDPTPSILNNTMIGNLATNSQGVSSFRENGGGVSSKSTSARMINNLIAFGSSGITTVRSSGDITFSNLQNNCIFGNATNYLRMPDLTGTNGNISADPLLATTNDFHLAMGSPCIDAGTNGVVSPGALDLDGQVRIFGASVDIGADEHGSVLPFTLLLSIEAEQAALKLVSEMGRTYVFEASSNLVNWTAFSTNQATNSLLEVGDEAYGSPAHRFYRARVVP